MRTFATAAFLLASAVVASAVAFPQEVNTKKLRQAEIRASLITKDNVAEYIANQRKKKAFPLKVPEPFMVSTSLNVQGESNTRRGRTFLDKDGSTVVVEGVRLPDDPSDKVTWRNGRVINNVFVPAGAAVPAETKVQHRQPKAFNFDDFYHGSSGQRPALGDNLAVESRSDQVYVEPPEEFKSQQARDYKFHAGSTNKGQPVYYVVEEPDSLHSDRSPYDFEPADTHTSLSSQVSDYTHSGFTQANSNDFVIKEHTYTMCPGCPTFSIPVPIPKASHGSLTEESSNGAVDYQHARNRTFLQKIGDRIVNGINKVQRNVLSVIDPILETGNNLLGIEDNKIEEKIDKTPSSKEGSSGNYLPLAIAGVAAMALTAFVASSAPTTQYLSSENTARSLDFVQKSIEKYD